jgi:predicted MarR family transcription regulator
VYATKNEAFNVGLELLLHQVKQNNDLKKYDDIIQMLQDELCPVVENQLSLF